MAASAGFSFDQSFNSDDEDLPQILPQGRNASVFVIDCSQSMFQEFIEDEEATSLFLKCLTVLERFLLNKIISSSKDLVSRHCPLHENFPPNSIPFFRSLWSCMEWKILQIQMA